MLKIFCGRYYKCQSESKTLAVISASHGDGKSIQLISHDGAWSFTENFRNSSFGNEGFRLNLQAEGVSVVGRVIFGELSPIKYDIMGPFSLVPFMQCRHSVYSMRHRVDGEIFINGESFRFDNALGYMEGDRGYSFPTEYLWTQSFFADGSLMLSVADIPFGVLSFTGVIGVILWRGKEYRLATYLGARAEIREGYEVIIRQGRYVFSAKLIKMREHALNAPVKGAMLRSIGESVSCHAAYRFEEDGKILFDFTTDRASFEFEYGGKNEQISI